MATVRKTTAKSSATPTKPASTKATTPSAKPQVAKKAAAKSVAKPAVQAAPKAPEPATPAPKPAKVKLVRDGFTIPASEYAVLAELKQRALSAAHPVKKSELLRAGIKLLAGLNDKAFLAALTAVPAVKTGRPGKK